MRVLAAMLLASLISIAPVFAASFEDLMAQGQAAYKAGNFVEAGKLLKEAGDQLQKNKDPRGLLLWGNAAIALIKAEDYAQAASLYEQILAQKNPPKEKLGQYYANLVHCLGMLKQPALQIEAINRQLKAINKMAPADLAETYARLGDAYRGLELYGPAASAYDKAIFALPKTARPEQRAKLLTALGQCQYNLGDVQKAQANLVEARKLAASLGEDLTIAEADSNLGILHMEQGDYPEAMKLFDAAIKREKAANLKLNEGSDWNNMGIAKRGTGNYSEAMAHINDAIAIAKEVGNTKGEAIATLNRALGYRMAGQIKEARADYAAARDLFQKAGNEQGKGTTLMGTGRMAELEDKNYVQAQADYLNALEIFRKLELPRWEGTALLYLAGLNKRSAAPGRTTRDLVFDDEPTNLPGSAEETLAKAREYYEGALAIGERLNSREMIWEALQGLGFTDFKAGRLEKALENYEKAIGIVTAIYVSAEDAQMLGEFMAGREDLYREAMEVCAALYDKTKDPKYLNLQMRYGETLKNDVQKANMALANLSFEDPAKQKLFEKLNALGKAQAKAAKAVPAVPDLPKDATPEQKAKKKMTEKAASEQKAVAQKLEGDYTKLLAEWKKKYPNDANVFDSSARVDLATLLSG